MIKHFFRISVLNISLFITFIFLVLLVLVEYFPKAVPLLSSITQKAMVDAKLRLRGPRPLIQDIVLVTIDDKSIERLGRWPWNRKILAEGLEMLAKANPKLIAFDMVFSEPDPSSASPVLRNLAAAYPRRHTQDPFYTLLKTTAERSNTDRFFSKTIQSTNKTIPILLGYFFYFPHQQMEGLQQDPNFVFSKLNPSRITAKIGTIRHPPEVIPTAQGATISLEDFMKATPHQGFFDIAADADGTIRSSHLIGQFQNTLFPSLGLKVASLVQNQDIVVKFDEYGIEQIFLGTKKIPSTINGKFWINYAGPANTFQHIGFLDVVDHKVKPEQLKNKIVLWGVTAKAVGDVRVSPVDETHPGLEINATIAENILHQNYLLRPTQFIGYELVWIFVMGILLGLLFRKLKALASALLTLFIIAGCLIIDYQFLFLKGYLANSFLPSLHILFTFMLTTAYKYKIEEKKSREIREAFQHYVSPAVVQEILKKPDQLKLGGEKRKLTVLFSDIRGFTTLSEATDPEKLTHLLNVYLTDMTNIVFESHGMLDKYVGDELMAVFGAPLPTPSHVQNACDAAIAMIQKLSDVRKLWEQEGVRKLDIGIGVHTGDMIVGNMGSNKIFNYTVIGDSVNLGARLEGTNKEYGTHIIISEDVYAQLGGSLLCRELDFIRVRGKQKPVRIYELLAFAPAHIQDLLNRFQEGLQLYRQQSWMESSRIFQALIHTYPHDGPSRTFYERSQIFQKTPPNQDWDGVFVMKTK
ncbi:MAG: adenylate/guanylate cyclase domain-containing protein [Deltaproteobacteria bacterium]|nr:adenylate/guanylate cyclase domain-containing protein [Deltaproteobacteria bacterium]